MMCLLCCRFQAALHAGGTQQANVCTQLLPCGRTRPACNRLHRQVCKTLGRVQWSAATAGVARGKAWCPVQRWLLRRCALLAGDGRCQGRSRCVGRAQRDRGRGPLPRVDGGCGSIGTAIAHWLCLTSVLCCDKHHVTMTRGSVAN